MSSTPSESSLVELRRYTLHPGQRDTLIDLFDREFVESQETQGLLVLGQFRPSALEVDGDRFLALLVGRVAGVEQNLLGHLVLIHKQIARERHA